MKPLHILPAWIGLLVIVGTLPGCTSDVPATACVMTVNGPIAPEQMGATLPHEHVLVDFAGAEAVSPTVTIAQKFSRR